MGLKKTLNLKQWKRKEHFEFFSGFDEPFFGVVSEVEVKSLLAHVEAAGYSLFPRYLHLSLLAANHIEPFRYRKENNKVVIYDEIHASATLGRNDGTFAFSFIPFHKDFEVFQRSFMRENSVVTESTGLRLNASSSRADTIHYSSLPWHRITGLTHARNFKIDDSAPKITFGKIFDRDNTKIMAVSINAHHGLMDGRDVSQYLECFQELLNNIGK